MWRTLSRLLASLLLTAALTESLHAQELEDLFKKRDRGPPVPQYFLATLGTMAVLVTVCVPSRKR